MGHGRRGLNSALVERWLPNGTGTTLKTDLWDEAMAGFVAEETTAIVDATRPIAVMIGQRVQGGGRFLRALAALERLEQAPTRFVTGHFVAIRATHQA